MAPVTDALMDSVNKVPCPPLPLPRARSRPHLFSLGGPVPLRLTAPRPTDPPHAHATQSVNDIFQNQRAIENEVMAPPLYLY